MAVEFQPDFSSRIVEASQAEQLARPSERVSGSLPASESHIALDPKQSAFALAQQTNVAFRRDSNGQIYYVFSDANTGREIQELPPKQVRAVGQGIADFMKDLEEKSSKRLEIRG